MRLKWIALLACVLAATHVRAEGNIELKENRDKASYGIGLSIANNFKRQGIDVNGDALMAGLKDGLSGAKPQLTEEQVREVLTVWEKEMKEKMMAQRTEQSTKNKTDGEKFLAENKTKEGIKTLPSGVQYKVLKDGTGPSPKATDTVTTNYRGTLIDGTVFDSTKEGAPAKFPVNQVIKGWTEVLQLMKVGSKWQIFIPSELAYGANGAGAAIGPNATLVFDIELLGVN